MISVMISPMASQIRSCAACSKLLYFCTYTSKYSFASAGMTPAIIASHTMPVRFNTANEITAHTKMCSNPSVAIHFIIFLISR